jgi:hypothetical protein
MESQAGRGEERRGSDARKCSKASARGKPSRSTQSKAHGEASGQAKTRRTRGRPAQRGRGRRRASAREGPSREKVGRLAEAPAKQTVPRPRAASVPAPGSGSGRAPGTQALRGISADRPRFWKSPRDVRGPAPGIAVALATLLCKVCETPTAVNERRRRDGRGALPRDTAHKEAACRASRRALMHPSRGTPSRLRPGRSPARA